MLHDEIKFAVKGIVARLGYVFWGMLFDVDTVKVFIEHVNVDDCQIISKAVITELKVLDHEFVDSFNWEFSSPGLDRYFFNVEQFKGYLGENIKLETLEGKKTRGRLVKVSEDNIFLKTLNSDTSFDFSSIKSAQMLVNI